MKLLAKMLVLVATTFENTFDKQGRPYFEHCYYVMQNCGLQDEKSLCIALAHDGREDFPEIFTEEFITKEFGSAINLGINVLTHKDNESYEEYIGRIAMYPDFIPIKLADLKHNMDASRLKGIEANDIQRMIKYMNSYITLKNAYNA